MQIKDYAILMVTKLKSMPEQSRISTEDLLSLVAPDAENVDLPLLHRYLLEEVKQYRMVLEMPIQNRYIPEEYHKHKFTLYHRKAGVTCPKCGSTFTSKVIYGNLENGEDVAKKLANKEIVWGGCCVGEHPEDYFCSHCRKGFGKHYHLSQVQSFFLQHDEMTIELCANEHGATLKVNGEEKRPLSKTEWETLLREMMAKAFVLDWKPTYINKTTLAGNLWRIEIQLKGDKPRKYRGWNAFSPYWDVLMRLLNDTVKRRGQ